MKSTWTTHEMDVALRSYGQALAPSDDRLRDLEAHVCRVAEMRFGTGVLERSVQSMRAVHSVTDAPQGMLTLLRALFMRPAFGIAAIAALAFSVMNVAGRMGDDATLAGATLPPQTSSAVASSGSATVAQQEGVNALPKSIFETAVAVAPQTAPTQARTVRPAATDVHRVKSVFSDEEIATQYRRGKNLFVDEERDQFYRNRSIFFGG
ncbi:MAG: hypothetical protein Q7S96_04715 [bacterium]|nr:hypothetical protein [bacterium]